MARGFLSGVLWGGVFSIAVAGAASIISPQPPSPDVSADAPGTGQSPTAGEGASVSGTSQSDGAVGLTSGDAQVAAPEPDTLAALNGDATQSAAQPRTGAADSLNAPEGASSGGSLTVRQDDPVASAPQGQAPQSPTADDNLSISTVPAQPPQPETQAPSGAFDAPDVPQAGATDGQNALAQPQNGTPPTNAAVAPEAPQTPDVPSADIEEPATAEPPAEADQAADAETQDLAALRPADRPAIGTPATTLTDREDRIAVNRPQTGQTADQTPAPGNSADAAVPDNPLTAFAQPFENAEDKPLMSIVLIDDGTSPTAGAAGIAALRSFPYPLTYAVDTSMTNASERMALYRKEGFEVLALIDLPQGAGPVDVETVFGVVLPQMTEVVGVLEGDDTGLQSSREVSDQVTEILAQTGHGLVTQDKGLNTMPKLARKAGVAAAPVFRDFDSKGQTATVIRRFLDQAAFKAGQEGAVIMLGRSRPDTISALLLWGLQDRAGQVALAPVSAVLLRDAPQ